MGSSIHPTAVIDPQATIGCNVSIGPFCVIEAGAIIGDGCRLASRVVVKERTTLGAANEVDEGTVLGGRPQHIARHDQWGHLRIGAGNMIRENVTIHRAMSPDKCDGRRGRQLDHGQRARGARLPDWQPHDHHEQRHAGRPRDRGRLRLSIRRRGSAPVLSHRQSLHGGRSIAHQQGRAALRDGGRPVSTRVVGLNVIGLKRRGFTPHEILQLKQAYRIIYRQGLTWEQVLERLSTTFTSGPAANFYPFLRVGQRGFVLERRTPVDATIPLPQLKVEAGILQRPGGAAESRVSRPRPSDRSSCPHPGVRIRTSMTKGGLGSPPKLRKSLLAQAFFERGLGGGQTCDGHAERRAADVVQAHLVAELDGRGIATVFAADADLEVLLRRTPLGHSHLDQLAHAFRVERLERIDQQNSCFR